MPLNQLKRAFKIILDIIELRKFYAVPIFLLAAIPILFISENEMEKSANRCLYVLVVMALTWLTESLPISATALFPLVLFPLMGVMTAKTTSSSYISDTSMLFLGGLIVAVAVEEWNLHKRIAVSVLMIVGSDPKFVMAGLMLPTWFLSMWISNTATASMMLPISVAVLNQIKEVRTGAAQNFDAIPEDEEHAGNGGVVNPGYVTENGQQPPPHEKMTQVVQTHAVVRTPVHRPPPDLQGFDRLSKGLTLCIAYAANIGGTATLTGTPPNLVMKGQADEYYERYQPEGSKTGSPISFANWMGLAVPMSAIVLVLGWLLLVVIFLSGRGCLKQNAAEAKAIKRVIQREWKNLGRITLAEIIMLVMFVLLAVLWVSRDPKESPGWNVWFKYREGGTGSKTAFPSDSTSAMLIAVTLFILPAKVPNFLCWSTPERANDPVYTPVLNWEVVQRKLPWGVIILLGGGFALAKGVEESRLNDWLGEKLQGLSHLEDWQLNLCVCLIVAVATEVTSNTATATLIMPIMFNLAVKLEINPLYLMISSALATSFAFMLPVATPPNAIVFSAGSVRVIDMAFAGLFMNCIAVGILTLAVNTWGKEIYDFDDFEDIFKDAVA